MTVRVTLMCALLAACSRSSEAARPPQDGGTRYLVARSGRTYRVLGSGPLSGADGQKRGATISYAAGTRDLAQLESDAEEIVGAAGLEMEQSGETALVVRAELGSDPRRTPVRALVYDVAFDLRDGRWVRASAKPEEPRPVEGRDGPPAPPYDPSFPFDPARLEAAAKAAARWAALLEAGDLDASAAGATEAFRSQVSVERWSELLAERSKRAGGERRELYRMQTRGGTPQAPAGVAAVFVYEIRPPQGGRFLERIMLLEERGAWRPAGYGFDPVPAR